MDRKRYEGVVLSWPDEQGRSVDYVLVEFLGEGAEHIVYLYAPRHDLANRQRVLKFRKPEPRLEMSVLHHEFRIAEELYPEHPLCMAPQERLQRLAAEVAERTASPGMVFGVPAFVDLLESAISGLATHYHPRFQAGTLAPGFLHEQPAFVPSLDETLAVRIDQWLDDDIVIDELRDFLAHCAERIRATAASREGATWAGNRLYTRLGLHLQDYISEEELIALTQHPLLEPPPSRHEIDVFCQCVPALYYRAESRLPERPSMGRELARAARAAGRLLEASALQHPPPMAEAVAMARNWTARTLLLEGDRAGAIAMHESALAAATTPDARAERHDALIDLAQLLADSEPARAQELAAQAERLRAELRG